MTRLDRLANQRRHMVDEAFAAFERQGGIVTPNMRQSYGRYMRLECSLRDLIREVETKADKNEAQGADVFMFQKKGK